MRSQTNDIAIAHNALGIIKTKYMSSGDCYENLLALWTLNAWQCSSSCWSARATANKDEERKRFFLCLSEPYSNQVHKTFNLAHFPRLNVLFMSRLLSLSLIKQPNNSLYDNALGNNYISVTYSSLEKLI